MEESSPVNNYTEEYYSNYGHDNRHYLDSAGIRLTTGYLAKRIKETRPRTHLDVGCALGLLVEKLREKGVESYGVDSSEYAIAHCVAGARRFCSVGHLPMLTTERRYDIVSCIEVVEHIDPDLTDACIDNLCQLSDVILFSSDYNFAESTHINVRQAVEWELMFLNRGYTIERGSDGIPWSFLARKANSRKEVFDVADRVTRSATLQRDHYRCVECNKAAQDVHEIIPRSAFGKSRSLDCFAPRNRVSLCRECHSRAHTVESRKKHIGIMRQRHGYEYNDETYLKYMETK